MAFKAKIEKGKGFGAGKRGNCVRVTTGSEFLYGAKPRDPWGSFGGRKLKFDVCAVGGGIQVWRAGRRGGARRVTGAGEPARGGMVACHASGTESKCIRTKSLLVLAGGAGRLRRMHPGKQMVLNGYAGHRRRRRRR